MKKILFSLLAMNVFISPASANDVSQSAATHFISTFYQALQQHDLATVNRMIDDDSVVKIVWMQANPPQTLTLKKADYLQQLKATWRFATHDRYNINNLKVNSKNGVTIVALQQSENRLLFGKKTRQENDLTISLANHNNTLRIIAIHSKTTFW